MVCDLFICLLMNTITIMDPFPANIKDINSIINLVESGVDINKKYGYFHETLLHLAAQNNWIETVQYLVSKGADVNARDRFNYTPLHDAAYGGHMDIIKCFLENGADKFAINDDNDTAAQAADGYIGGDITRYIESFELIPTKGVQE